MASATFVCRHFAFVWTLLAGSLFCLSTATAQVVGPSGVYIDPQGVLQQRELSSKERADRKKRAEKSGSMHYVSLPRLLAQTKLCLEEKRPIDDSLRYLGGIVRLTHVFAVPEEGDLVIAGPAEKFETPATGDRPVGIETGTPVLCLDDLVVCFRTLSSGNRAIGCSIDLPDGAVDRVNRAAESIGGIAANQARRAEIALASAVGPQPCRTIGVAPDNKVARICIEADFIMKRLNLGAMDSPVRGVKSQLSQRGSKDAIYSRFWFYALYEPLLMSEDGNSYELRGQRLGVKASDSPTQDTNNASASAQRFAEQMTEHFDELSRHILSFAELGNVTDLSVLAALIQHDRLDQRCGLDLDWLRDESIYPIEKVEFPKQVNTIAVSKSVRRAINFMIGGVSINPTAIVSADRQKDAELSATLRRPTGEEWLLKVPKE